MASREEIEMQAAVDELRKAVGMQAAIPEAIQNLLALSGMQARWGYIRYTPGVLGWRISRCGQDTVGLSGNWIGINSQHLETILGAQLAIYRWETTYGTKL